MAGILRLPVIAVPATVAETFALAHQRVHGTRAAVSVVLKVNGGANAGHTADGIKLNLLPSGVVVRDVPHLCIGSGVVADPRKFWWEARPLEQRGYGILDRLSVQGVAQQELIAGVKHATRRELDRIDTNLRLRKFRCLGARQAQDSDPSHVAFQQRVGSLRRAVGEKNDVAGIDAGLTQDLLEHLDDAGSDTVRMVMGGVNGGPPCDAAIDVVDQGGFGESSSYVDSDAIGFFARDFVHGH